MYEAYKGMGSHAKALEYLELANELEVQLMQEESQKLPALQEL